MKQRYFGTEGIRHAELLRDAERIRLISTVATEQTASGRVIARMRESTGHALAGVGILICTIAFLILFASGCSVVAESAYVTEMAPMSSNQKQSMNELGMGLSQALSNGKPILILFTPVEMCQIRYCIQPSHVVSQLGQHYSEQVNLVVAPVYAIDTPKQPAFPMVDWPVYMVEPYSNWAPALEQTIFGWGLSAPEAVLVSTEGRVVARSYEHWSVETLNGHIEQLVAGQ